MTSKTQTFVAKCSGYTIKSWTAVRVLHAWPVCREVRLCVYVHGSFLRHSHDWQHGLLILDTKVYMLWLSADWQQIRSFIIQFSARAGAISSHFLLLLLLLLSCTETVSLVQEQNHTNLPTRYIWCPEISDLMADKVQRREPKFFICWRNF